MTPPRRTRLKIGLALIFAAASQAVSACAARPAFVVLGPVCAALIRLRVSEGAGIRRADATRVLHARQHHLGASASTARERKEEEGAIAQAHERGVAGFPSAPASSEAGQPA